MWPKFESLFNKMSMPCGDGASLTGEDDDERESLREFEAAGVEDADTWGRQANSWRSKVVRVRF